jgi:hypothetical protein
VSIENDVAFESLLSKKSAASRRWGSAVGQSGKRRIDRGFLASPELGVDLAAVPYTSKRIGAAARGVFF